MRIRQACAAAFTIAAIAGARPAHAQEAKPATAREGGDAGVADAAPSGEGPGAVGDDAPPATPDVAGAPPDTGRTVAVAPPPAAPPIAHRAALLEPGVAGPRVAPPRAGHRSPDAEVTSETSAQFYDVRSPTGETVLSRRRLISTLGVSVYDLLERDEGDPRGRLGPELTFRARLRYDADYGASSAETDVTNYGRLVPSFARGPVDLMYGYVEGRRFLGGWLGFKLGRQYVTDALGWYAFDGGQVRVTTPYFFALEAYGGLEVRGGMPLSTPRFERDGVWRGDRTGYDPSLYPSFQPSDVAPVVGVALDSTGVTWLHGRLTYRRAMNTGASNVSQFASGLTTPASYDGTRVSSERVGYSVDANVAEALGARAGIAYDVYLARVASLFASVDVFATKRLTLGVDYDFYQPTFDADSIWNFFASEPMNDLGVRATLVATDRLSLSAGAHARVYTLQTAQISPIASPNIDGPGADRSYYPSSALAFDEGGNLAARYKWGEGALGVRGSGNFGDGGDRVGGDVYAERLLETRYVLEGRASLWQWNDKLRPGRDATSVGYVAGVGYRFAPRSQALFEIQHDVNRLVGHRFRAMIWLSVAVSK
jgi:hypothetical protein